MRRLLLTISEDKCPYGCRYCFADFKQYQKVPALETVENNPELLDGVDVVYPACDTDIFATENPLYILARTGALGCSVSISTKGMLTPYLVEEIAEIGEMLREHGHVLKVGISFSTKNHIHEFEPNTADYDSRLENLELLSRFGVSSCVVLKPLLAEIAVEEYCEILEDVSRHRPAILLGEEYLNPSAMDELTRDRPAVKVKHRSVAWLAGEPNWPASNMESHATQIISFAEKLGLRCFDSDIDLMGWLIAENTQIRRPEKVFS